MLRTAATTLGLRAGAASPLALVQSLRGFAAKAPAGVFYAKSHEWVKVQGDVGTVGITDFAQAELGDIVFVELPEVGEAVTKGKQFGVVESVKAASDVYSPISGKVLEVNSDLVKEGSLINTDAFGKGWMMKVKLTNAAETGELLDAGKYDAFCEAGGH